MQTTAQRHEAIGSGEVEYVTIIASSAAEVMRQFHARGLPTRGFSIAGRVGRHQFTFAEDAGTTEMFGGRAMVAATFVRLASQEAAA